MINNRRIKIEKVIIKSDKFPVVTENIIIKECLEKMNKLKIGIVCVVDVKKKLKGIFTDGDFRRKILKVQKPLSFFLNDDIKEHMNKKPVTVFDKDNLIKAIKIMEKKKIWDLPVVEKNNNKLKGLLHLHPAISELLK
jgi:CBS domain-containing protein